MNTKIKEKFGSSFLEIIFVVSVIALIASAAFFSMSSSFSDIAVRSAMEKISSDISLLESKVVYSGLREARIVFSPSFSTFYYTIEKYNHQQSLLDQLASNLRVDKGSGGLVPVSSSQKGSAALAWDLPLVPSNPANKYARFVELAGNQVKSNSHSQDTSYSSSRMGDNDTYKFYLTNNNSTYKSESLNVTYFSPENIKAKSDDYLFLSLIEIEDFQGNYLPVKSDDEITIIMRAPLAKKRYYYLGNEYKSIRLSFSKLGVSYTMSL